MRTLQSLGWNNFFQNHLDSFSLDTKQVARVVGTYRDFYLLYLGNNTEVLAELSGKFRYQALQKSELPVVGDWVVFSPTAEGSHSTITQVLPRQTKLSRQSKTSQKDRGRVGEEQVLASNVDIVFIVSSLNQDLNLRRLERYMIMVAESGARPVVLLTKSDLCSNVEEKIDEVKSVVFSTPIHAISTYENSGLEDLNTYLGKGQSSVLVGSSGTGKSTLTNWLKGEELLETQVIREGDDKGKHTTTNRYLVTLPSGGMIIDTPGIRDIQLGDASHGIEQTFKDITALENECRFSDCQHQSEPDCAVRSAVDEGIIDEDRLKSYAKLSKEVAYTKRMDSKEDELRFKKDLKKLRTSYRKTAHARERERLRS
jgi:ribosome biogenesis GTPase